MAKENNSAEPEKIQADLPEVEQELSKEIGRAHV